MKRSLPPSLLALALLAAPLAAQELAPRELTALPLDLLPPLTLGDAEPALPGVDPSAALHGSAARSSAVDRFHVSSPTGASGEPGGPPGPGPHSSPETAVGHPDELQESVSWTPSISPSAVPARPAGSLLGHPDAALVPYGGETPRLSCAPLRACIVELEEGETLLATISGDTERWAIDRAAAGPRGRTSLLAIKPTACDLETNLVVTTDRRIYLLDLVAPPCPGGDPDRAGAAFTPLLRFSYPRLVEWQADPATVAAPDPARLALAAPVPVERLNFRYSWTRRGSFPWTPEAVFDDGVHTYIRLPGRARQYPAPVLFLVDERGATEVLNYAFRPGPGAAYYVTDRVVDRAALVLGSGRRQQRLTLWNEARAARREAEAR